MKRDGKSTNLRAWNDDVPRVGTILVVDDTDMNRDVLSRRLQRDGHEVVTAGNGREALQLISENEFDLVLLDVMMPEISGLEVLKQVRESKSMQVLPVIMATGLSETEDVIEGLRLGANDYVTKPLNFPVLQARVATQLGLKAMSDELNRLNQRMKQGLVSAAHVQKAGLPIEIPEGTSFRFAWRFCPCEELAGDGMALIPIDERFTVVALWDVSGHGVPASLLSVAISHTLSPRVGRNSVIFDAESEPPRLAEPAAVASRLNEIFPMICSHNLHFTMCYGILDNEQGTFQFSSAGHPPPIQVGAGDSLVEHVITGFPIGVVDADLSGNAASMTPSSPSNKTNGETMFRESTVRLSEGDRLFLYSDGLIEEPNEEGEFFGSKHFHQTLRDIHDVDVDAGLDRLLGGLEAWRGGKNFNDDVSVLAIERKDCGSS